MENERVPRRTVLDALAVTGTATLGSLAGCLGGGGGDDGEDDETTTGEDETTAGDEETTAGEDETTTGDEETTTGDDETTTGDGGGVSPEEYPDVDEWLTTDEVGAPAPNYDGTIVDERDADSMSIAVGAGENGLAFDPPAVAVSAGTTVTWEWTGEGGAHNVEAEPEEQIQASDYEFSSGEPEDGDSVTFEQQLDEAGIALYHCEPHLTVGMKGAVVVVE